MIVKQYIKDFEELGFGMFVHFGLYSRLGKGEWARFCLHIPAEEYEPLQKEFAPKPTWAKELAATKALVWPLFYTGVFYLVFVGFLTIVLGRVEKKLGYFRS